MKTRLTRHFVCRVEERTGVKLSFWARKRLEDDLAARAGGKPGTIEVPGFGRIVLEEDGDCLVAVTFLDEDMAAVRR